MITFPNGETVILHHRTLAADRDADGNDVFIPGDTSVEGCAFAPAGSTEVVQGQDTVTTQPTVYIPRDEIPAGVSITAVDAVTARGDRYEVDGAPEDFRSPFVSFVPPLVIRLKNVTG